MRVTVEFVGPMRRPWPERRRQIEVVESSSIAELLRSLGYGDEEARHFSFLVAGGKASLDTVLQPDTRVSVLLMVGGG